MHIYAFFIFFGQQFLLVSSFFFFTISGTRLDGVIDGEGGKGGSADVAVKFTLMMISLS